MKRRPERVTRHSLLRAIRLHPAAPWRKPDAYKRSHIQPAAADTRVDQAFRLAVPNGRDRVATTQHQRTDGTGLPVHHVQVRSSPVAFREGQSLTVWRKSRISRRPCQQYRVRAMPGQIKGVKCGLGCRGGAEDDPSVAGDKPLFLDVESSTTSRSEALGDPAPC